MENKTEEIIELQKDDIDNDDAHFIEVMRKLDDIHGAIMALAVATESVVEEIAEVLEDAENESESESEKEIIPEPVVETIARKKRRFI
jgi:hypothetical protein